VIRPAPRWVLVVHVLLGLAFLGALLGVALHLIHPVTGTIAGFVLIVAGALFHMIEFQRRNW
jgi:putative effector of murein hydrolase LrgA (UPF0299 family)